MILSIAIFFLPLLLVRDKAFGPILMGTMTSERMCKILSKGLRFAVLAKSHLRVKLFAHPDMPQNMYPDASYHTLLLARHFSHLYLFSPQNHCIRIFATFNLQTSIDRRCPSLHILQPMASDDPPLPGRIDIVFYS